MQIGAQGWVGVSSRNGTRAIKSQSCRHLYCNVQFMSNTQADAAHVCCNVPSVAMCLLLPCAFCCHVPFSGPTISGRGAGKGGRGGGRRCPKRGGGATRRRRAIVGRKRATYGGCGGRRDTVDTQGGWVVPCMQLQWECFATYCV